MRWVALIAMTLAVGVGGLFGANFPVEFIRLTDRITIHRSYELYEGMKTPSNGLIVEGESGVLLIDTAWNNEETKQILDYIRNKIQKNIDAVLITHFHSDRAGGIGALLENHIEVSMTKETAELLRRNLSYKKIVFGGQTIAGLSLDVEYFGPAHSHDNITVYFPNDKVFFGGCLVKSLNSTSIGNTTDADVKNWPRVIERMAKTYEDAEIVVPGHGDPGNRALFTHTLELLRR